jgi:hypothetical protein
VRELGLNNTTPFAFYYDDADTVEDQLAEALKELGDDLAGCWAMFQPGDPHALQKLKR